MIMGFIFRSTPALNEKGLRLSPLIKSALSVGSTPALNEKGLRRGYTPYHNHNGSTPALNEKGLRRLSNVASLGLICSTPALNEKGLRLSDISYIPFRNVVPQP